MHTFASGSCVYVCPCARGHLAPGITWLDSSPRLHTSRRTSACAGCMCQPGWHRGLEPGREALGGNTGQQHKIYYFFFLFFAHWGVVHCWQQSSKADQTGRPGREGVGGTSESVFMSVLALGSSTHLYYIPHMTLYDLRPRLKVFPTIYISFFLLCFANWLIISRQAIKHRFLYTVGLLDDQIHMHLLFTISLMLLYRLLLYTHLGILNRVIIGI